MKQIIEYCKIKFQKQPILKTIHCINCKYYIFNSLTSMIERKQKTQLIRIEMITRNITSLITDFLYFVWGCVEKERNAINLIFLYTSKCFCCEKILLTLCLPERM